MSLLDNIPASGLPEKNLNTVVSEQRNLNTLTFPTAADRPALLKKMRNDPNVRKKTRPKDLIKTLNLLKKLGQ